MYVIVEKATGLPLHLLSTHNGEDRYACGEFWYSLVRDTDRPLFQCQTAEHAMEVLSFPQEYYNSSIDHPTLGNFEKDELAVYLMSVKLTLAETKEPLIIDKGTSNRRALPYIVAKRLAPLAPKDKSCTVIVVNTAKAGVSADQIRSRVGDYIYMGPYNKRRLWGVAEAREEWREFGDLEIVCSSF